MHTNTYTDSRLHVFMPHIFQVSPLRQIDLFAQYDQSNPDIATFLSDIAFKAMESIVKVSIFIF